MPKVDFSQMDAATIALKKAYAQFNSGEREEGMLSAVAVAAEFAQYPLVQVIAARLLSGGSKHAEALKLLDHALQLDSNCVSALVAKGLAHQELAEYDQAELAYRLAQNLDPANPEICHQLSMNLLHRGSFGEAFELAKIAFAGLPLDESVVLNYFRCFSVQDLEGALSFLRDAVADRPASLELAHMLAMEIQYSEVATEEEVIKAVREAGKRLDLSVIPLPPPKVNLDPERKLRLGILSPELRAHAVSGFLGPLLEHLSRDEFEIILYPLNSTFDHHSAILKDRCEVRPMTRKDPGTVAWQIREDEIDILIETTGWFGNGSPQSWAMQPAPIQMHLLGFPNSIGSSRLTARLGDFYVDLPDSDQDFLEKIVRIDPPFMCFKALSGLPEIGPSRLADVPPIFGTFNNSRKLGPTTVACWRRILDRVPGSTLVLKSSIASDPVYYTHGENLIIQAGLRDRTTFYPAVSLEDNYVDYGKMDIGLDAFPFNGAATTMDSLVMGVPVITRRGIAARSRVAAMMVEQIGESSWVADDVDGYVEAAVQLASRVQGVREGRQELRDRVLSSSLCDGNSYAQKVGVAWRELWRDYCANPRR